MPAYREKESLYFSTVTVLLPNFVWCSHEAVVSAT
jgi:hypothetical protein